MSPLPPRTLEFPLAQVFTGASLTPVSSILSGTMGLLYKDGGELQSRPCRNTYEASVSVTPQSRHMWAGATSAAAPSFNV